MRPSFFSSFACRMSATVFTFTRTSGCASNSCSRNATFCTADENAAGPLPLPLSVTFTAVRPDARALPMAASVNGAAKLLFTLNGPGVARQSIAMARS